MTILWKPGAKARHRSARAGDIGRGGESAFGSRARLGASERREALGRGLAEALGGIRAPEALVRRNRTGLGEFARQKSRRKSRIFWH